MIPLKKIREIISQHKRIEQSLSSGTIDKKDFAKKSKEYSDLNEIIKNAKEYENFSTIKSDLEMIINDNKNEIDIKNLAKSELSALVEKNNINEKKLKLFLLPKDEADSKNAILEIRAGTGGLEASLFAGDLFKMYEKICSKKKWNLEIISISQSEAGGLKEVVALIKTEASSDCVPLTSSPVWKVPCIELPPKVNSVISFAPIWNFDTASTIAVAPEDWPVIVLPISNDVSEPANAIALNILFVVHLPSEIRNIFSLG